MTLPRIREIFDFAFLALSPGPSVFVTHVSRGHEQRTSIRDIDRCTKSEERAAGISWLGTTVAILLFPLGCLVAGSFKNTHALATWRKEKEGKKFASHYIFELDFFYYRAIV